MAPLSGPMNATSAERSGGRSLSDAMAACKASADDRPPYAVRPCNQLSGTTPVQPPASGCKPAMTSRRGTRAGSVVGLIGEG